MIELRHAKTLESLRDSMPINIWHKHDSGEQSELIWAPEIHFVCGEFYIYYAAAHKKKEHEYDKTFQHRMYAIKCTGQNPIVDSWQECCQIKTRIDSFSLDGTVLQTPDTNYNIWAQKEIGSDSNSNIYISKMLSPTKLSDKQVCISKPELSFVIQGFKVNEVPLVLIKDDRVF